MEPNNLPELAGSRPTAPEPDWERLQRAAKVYGAAMHKAGQEEVRRSEYRERAQELMLAARDELDAAFRAALASRLEPSDRLEEIRRNTEILAKRWLGADAPRALDNIAWLIAEVDRLRAALGGSRTAPEPSEAAIQAILTKLWPNASVGTPSNKNQYAGGYLDALQAFAAELRGGSPQPPAGDLDALREALELIARQPTHPRQGITRAEMIATARAALRGGSHQPEESPK